MATCKSCGASYSGPTRDDFCPVCQERDNHRIYADPLHDPDAWKRRMNYRYDAYRAFLRVHYTPPPTAVTNSIKGVCKLCGRPLDDHSLIYSGDHYPIGLCQVPDC